MAKMNENHKYTVGTRVKVVAGGVPSDLDGRTGTIVHRYLFSQDVVPEYAVRMDHNGPGDEDWNVLEFKLEPEVTE